MAETDPELDLIVTRVIRAPRADVTAEISFADHPDGTAYEAKAMHGSPADRARHEELGFEEGWGTVTRQLAELVEA